MSANSYQTFYCTLQSLPQIKFLKYLSSSNSVSKTGPASPISPSAWPKHLQFSTSRHTCSLARPASLTYPLAQLHGPNTCSSALQAIAQLDHGQLRYNSQISWSFLLSQSSQSKKTQQNKEAHWTACAASSSIFASSTGQCSPVSHASLTSASSSAGQSSSDNPAYQTGSGIALQAQVQAYRPPSM